jgi:hypothetical protein
MSQLVAVVGPTGSGKSTSISHLEPQTTYVINVAAKPLPFKGSARIYNVDNKNYAEMDDPKEILTRLRTLSEKAPHIKDIIIDDGNYTMGFTMVRKATETGYTKFSLMAKDMVALLTEAAKLRKDMKIYYFSHPEEVYDGDSIVGYKMLTAGKLIDNQIKLEGLFTVCLYTNVEEKKDGEVEYTFVTNRWKKYPAKSPMGMFDKLKIPNNLQMVSKTIDEYYA